MAETFKQRWIVPHQTRSKLPERRMRAVRHEPRPLRTEPLPPLRLVAATAALNIVAFVVPSPLPFELL